jgi:hypothetical protein
MCSSYLPFTVARYHLLDFCYPHPHLQYMQHLPPASHSHRSHLVVLCRQHTDHTENVLPLHHYSILSIPLCYCYIYIIHSTFMEHHSTCSKHDGCPLCGECNTSKSISAWISGHAAFHMGMLSYPFPSVCTADDNQSSLVQGDSWWHTLMQHWNVILWCIHWIMRHASFNLLILQLTARNFSSRIWEFPPLAIISTIYSYYSPWGILWHHSFTQYAYWNKKSSWISGVTIKR